MHTCAALVHDSMLLAKLTGGDMIATEEYHPSCLLNLCYKAGRAKSSEDNDDIDENLPEISGEMLASTDVIAHIENRKILNATPAVFKLPKLNKLYC